MKPTFALALLMSSVVAAGCNDGPTPVELDFDETSANGFVIAGNGTASRSSKVTFTFQVTTTSGDPVSGLTREAGNFDLLEDGSAVSKWESASGVRVDSARFVARTVLLLDLSGSISRSGYIPQVKEAAVSFVNNVMPVGSGSSRQVGIWWFDGNEKLHTLRTFTSDRAALISAIGNIKAGMATDSLSTDLNSAAIEGITLAGKKSADDRANNILSSNAVVLFTDGKDEAARKSMTAVMTTVNQYKSNVLLYSIGLGDPTQIDEQSLAQIGVNGFFPVRDANNLKAEFDRAAQRISDVAGSFYVIEYCSPRRAGNHTLRMNVTRGAQSGAIESKFNADGFTGSCSID